MNFNFKTIEASAIADGDVVLLRLDLNVPIVHGAVLDDFRIERSLPTLRMLQSHGAKTVIISHIDSAETDSLEIVAQYLGNIIPLTFVPSLSKLSESLKTMKSGEFLLLENIRRNPGEMEDDENFSKTLASYGKLYVNEAFSVSHRKHASVVGVPRFIPSYAGLLFAREVANLSKAFHPPNPFVFILAGAKIETKFPLVKKFLQPADSIFIGGVLANDLLLSRGYEIGLSTHSLKDLGFADIAKNPKIILPVDVVVENAGKKETKDVEKISTHERIVDAGPKTVAMLKERMKGAAFIVWNGTLGEYERGFAEGTEGVARAISESKAEAVVGGGDTLACISKLHLTDKFSFVSTGGGAMLEFLATETLPGIRALENSLKV